MIFFNFAQQQDVTVVDEGQRLAFSEALFWWQTDLTGGAGREKVAEGQMGGLLGNHYGQAELEKSN